MSSPRSISAITLVPYVALGGGLGAMLRALTQAFVESTPTDRGLSLLVVNLVGAFLLGVVYVRLDPKGRPADADLPLSRLGGRERLLAFIAAGGLGAFTTYSGVVEWLGAGTLAAIDLEMAVQLIVMLLGGPPLVVLGMACARSRST